MFIDYVEIEVEAGRGGDGCVSFRREKFIAKGGPDGGDGGRGGDVIVVSSENESTLQRFEYQRQFIAENGEKGRGAQCNGAGGASVEIRVPPLRERVSELRVIDNLVEELERLDKIGK